MIELINILSSFQESQIVYRIYKFAIVNRLYYLYNDKLIYYNYLLKDYYSIKASIQYD